MKTIYKFAMAAFCAAIVLAGCGNAGAQNDRKKASAKAGETTAKMVKELDADTFKTKVYDIASEELVYLGDRPAIVDFTATWCGPCQRITPILEELAAEYKDDIVIYKVDIDKNRELAQAFNVSSIPAILYIPAAEGEPVMTVGSRSKDKFKEEIRTFLLTE